MHRGARHILGRIRIWHVLVGLGVLVWLLYGVALLWRGPDPVSGALPAGQAVTLPDNRTLYVQPYEVSVAEWNACHAAGACALKLRVRGGMDAETTPATGISFVDAQQYLGWINGSGGQRYRLPTAAEWNALAQPVLPPEPDPIFTDPALSWASDYLTEGTTPRALRPQGSFTTSPAGISDLDGNVWEWTQDCYAGSAGEVDPDRCPAYFVGGVHMAAMAYLVRDPARGGCAVGAPPAHLGLRLVSDRPA